MFFLQLSIDLTLSDRKHDIIYVRIVFLPFLYDIMNRFLKHCMQMWRHFIVLSDCTLFLHTTHCDTLIVPSEAVLL